MQEFVFHFMEFLKISGVAVNEGNELGPFDAKNPGKLNAPSTFKTQVSNETELLKILILLMIGCLL